MRILGIDPGYAIVGYGAIDCMAGDRYRTLCYGAVQTKPTEPFCQRIEKIFLDMNELIEKVAPEAVAIERLYFQNNQKTAIDVAQARGVILLSAKIKCVPIFEYTPLQVKTVVTGYGKAKKPQVMNMTKRLLGLAQMPKLDDTADALAIAICHARACGSNIRLNMMKRGRSYNVL